MHPLLNSISFQQIMSEFNFYATKIPSQHALGVKICEIKKFFTLCALLNLPFCKRESLSSQSAVCNNRKLSTCWMFSSHFLYVQTRRHHQSFDTNIVKKILKRDILKMSHKKLIKIQQIEAFSNFHEKPLNMIQSKILEKMWVIKNIFAREKMENESERVKIILCSRKWGKFI